MANIYVRSTDGVNTDDGSTWALSKLDLVGAAAIDAAGDTIYVSQAHAESTTGAVALIFAGTPQSPTKIICANDGAEPPTAVGATATVTATSTISLVGNFHVNGIAFKAGSGGTATQSLTTPVTGATNNQVFDSCSLQLLTTGTGLATISLGDETRNDANSVTLRSTTVKFGGVNQRMKIACKFKWDGGSFVAGSVTPTSIFQIGLRGIGEFVVSNVDFSIMTAGVHLIAQATTGHAMTARLRNLILPASWTGNLWSATPTVPGIRAEMYNSFSGAVKYRVWVHDFAGQVRDNTTIYRTGGAVDDTVPFSIKFASTADTEYPLIALEGTPIKVYVDSTSSTTLSLEIVHDSQGAGTGGALRNDEVGLRVTYPGGVTETIKADVLATPADHPTSPEAWTTTGLTTPVKQKLSVTFTPTNKGEVSITPILFAASKTVYVCSKVGV